MVKGFLFLLLILATWCFGNSSHSRYQRLIFLYNKGYANYTTRTFHLNNNLCKNLSYTLSDSLSSSYGFHLLNWDLSGQYTKEQFDYTPEKRSITSADLWFEALFLNHGIAPKYGFNTSFASFFPDTNYYGVSIGASHKNEILKWMMPKNISMPFFLSASLQGTANISFHQNKNFLPLLDNIPFPEHFISNTISGTGALKIEAGLGYGKTINCAPLFQALFIEKLYLDKAIADFPFSDKTIINLAEYIAHFIPSTTKSFSVESAKKRDLDSLLNMDGSITNRNSRYITPFGLSGLLSHQIPQLNTGFSVRLLQAVDVTGSASRQWTSFLDDTLAQPGKKKDIRIPVSLYSGFELNWGKLMGLRSHILITGKKSLFFHDSASNNHIYTGTIQHLLDTRWELQATIFLTPKIFMQNSFSNIPAWIFIPRDLPDQFNISANLIVNERLTLTALGLYARQRYLSPCYTFFQPELRDSYPRIRITLSALYSL